MSPPTPPASAGPSAAARAPGLAAARLSPEQVARNFSDAHPPLSAVQAQVEAERCLYCFDAPCTTACPTGIDVPGFITRIAQGNLRGAARTILESNPLGGMCARVCPTEVLCEHACVRHALEERPVAIGALQRHATDALLSNPGQPLFSRAAPTGRRVAVVGAGPAGLACAHGLALAGHAVVVFEARPKGGGLNEYGIARYKTPDDFAQRELAWLLSVGGIELRCGQRLGGEITLQGLRADFDAVFLGLGLGGVHSLGLAEPELPGLGAAVDFIAELRQADDLSRLPVGRDVIVIGGGMTAVDAAVQCKLLGAGTVTIAYRRGPEAMPASAVEQQWAQVQGVSIRHWVAPRQVLHDGTRLLGLRLAATQLVDGRLVETDDCVDLPADMVLRAIGQTYLPQAAGTELALLDGRIHTDEDGRTSLAGVWAGGDCRRGGLDLTVQAVQDGKLAARSMHAALMAAVPR